MSGRTLAWGRHTKSDDAVVTEALRQAGLIGAFGNKGIFGNILDRLLFEAHGYEHILGSASQVASDFATMTWDQAQQRFENKAGAEVIVSNYQRVAVMGMDTLTDNIVIDNITGLEIFHIGNTPGQTGDNPKFQLGDSGGGVPYKIKLGPNTKDCKLDLLTDKPFRELSHTLTLNQKRYVANQGLNNYIKVNGVEIYNPSQTGEIIQLDALPANPYLLRMDGRKLHWSADASNVSLAWFRDLNIFLDGLIFNGTALQETQSRFSNPASIDLWLFQVNQVYRFLTDLGESILPFPPDTRIHERTSPTSDLNLIANFSLNSDIVTFVDFLGSGYEGDSKNYMRILSNLTPAPDISTILLVDINTATHTAKMIDALTETPYLSPGNATNEVVDVNNSGAAAGSEDEDRFQTHNHGTPGSTNLSATATGVRYGNSGNVVNSATIPTPARIHDQTQPRSTAVRFYYRP